MTGLEAISASNGWAISALGISIVFTGLTLLSITIAQLHKFLDMWEKRAEYYDRFKEKFIKKTKEQDQLESCTVLPFDVTESARNFKMLVDHIGEPFPLPKLLRFAKKCGLAHPHSSLNALILSGAIKPDDEGYYYWNKNISY